MSRRIRLHLLASRVHKWSALLIGVQLLLWFVSGALMSFLPIDRVHGDHLVERKQAALLRSDVALASPTSLLAASGVPIQAISYRMWLGRPIAEVTTTTGLRRFDAITGKALQAPSAADAEAVARAAWRGEGQPRAEVRQIREVSTEYRGSLPAWRVAFSDADSTRIFVTADTGQIVAVRTGTWRLYDFFWGLHIMDWKDHEDFNTPWLLAFAIGGLVLWIGGAVLLYMRWPVRPSKRRMKRGS